LNEPDFASYSADQLRQILTRIDAQRFPERVRHIHARLAELETAQSMRTGVDAPAPGDGPPEIAGFWRRSAAFLIDTLLLGLVGMCLGLVFGEQFEAMGAWGRMVGFLVMVAYFGSMDSRLYQGSSLGKRALDIRVVTTAGAPLGVGRAVLRGAVFYMPYFLNNVALGNGYSNIVLPALQAVLVFGLGGATAYLYLFNRRTRQSIHDLLVGSIVVRARRAAVPPVPPLWKGHVAAVAALFVLVIGATAYLHAISGKRFFASLRLVQQKVIAIPGVRNATVLENTSLTSADKRPKSLTIHAVSSIRTIAEKNALARKIAHIALTTYPAAQQFNAVSVVIMHGYDIGIASNWNTTTFNASPGAWGAKD
jgi:uncharacterized RDD family membrane protein YckC